MLLTKREGEKWREDIYAKLKEIELKLQKFEEILKESDTITLSRKVESIELWKVEIQSLLLEKTAGNRTKLSPIGKYLQQK